VGKVASRSDGLKPPFLGLGDFKSPLLGFHHNAEAFRGLSSWRETINLLFFARRVSGIFKHCSGVS
jgi:hypothetical protein